jgi:hypothetical protein
MRAMTQRRLAESQIAQARRGSLLHRFFEFLATGGLNLVFRPKEDSR